MTVKEYLHSANLTPDELAVILGYKTTGPVKNKLDQDMPVRWVRKLDELSDLGMAPIPPAPKVPDSDGDSEREPNSTPTDEQISSWINSEGRENDKDPNMNNAGNLGDAVIGPQKIKLKTIEGYIKAIYGGAESLARARGDHIAAETIHQYSPEFTEAWIDYIKYDDRILKYLEMLNIGTPLGNLVGIHAISIGAYVLARITAQELASIATANGTGESEL